MVIRCNHRALSSCIVHSALCIGFSFALSATADVIETTGLNVTQTTLPDKTILIKFLSSGTFTIPCDATGRILLVGGGGAGGADCSGGGGGGGMIDTNDVELAAGSYTVTVGVGGTAGGSRGENGGNSVLSFGGAALYTAIGGGGGGGWNSANGASGGSGGGATGNSGGTGGAGVEGQGYAGGNAAARSPAGGGGAGGPGENGANAGGPGSAGGPGRASDITGEEIYYGGGGGGGGYNYSAAPLINGGIGGGGNGARNVAIATRQATMLQDGRYEYEAECGVNGLGGGGGGANNSDQKGRHGGSGVVILRLDPLVAADAILIASSIAGDIGSPSPAYGMTTGLSADETRAVTCGATAVTNASGTAAYSCTGWKLYDSDDTLLSSGPETSFIYRHPTPAAFRRLEWQWNASVSGTIAAGPGGSVSNPGTAWHDGVTPVTVTAIPDPGLSFLRWVGTLPAGVDAASATVTFTPVDTFEMTAIFGTEHYSMSYAPNGDTIYLFNASGTVTLDQPASARLLLVGGGGAGGNDCSGGGGAGGMIDTNDVLLAAGTYTVTVGAGGTAGGARGGNGGNSVLSFGGSALFTAIGGGGGGGWSSVSGAAGGSGGGATSNGKGGAGTEGQGYAGGDAGNRAPAGGGGAGGPGSYGSNANGPGTAGGPGRASDITGEEIYYAGGGGGGGFNYNAAPLSNGGIGGGGNGARNVAIATRRQTILADGRTEYEAESGVDGLGGGGGGGNNSDHGGGSGGRGVVVIRVKATGEDVLYVSGVMTEAFSQPSPAYGIVSGLAAGEARAVSCGETVVTNEAGTVEYACTGWKLYDSDGNVVSNGTETSFIYTHPTPAAYRRLEWQCEVSAYRGVVTAGSGGTVSPSGATFFPAGTPSTVTATAGSYQIFAGWTGTSLPDGIDASSASVTFTPSAPFEMKAQFAGAPLERPSAIASGGTEIYADGGADVVHTFTRSGTFTVSVPTTARILLVGGGGAGGNTFGGGGGAGGMVEVSDVALAAGTYTVTVGAGGTPGSGQGCGGKGGNTSIAIGGVTLHEAAGGGGGGGWTSRAGVAGGSGGGGCGGNAGGAGTSGQGNAGATAGNNSRSGGGGGAGEAGHAYTDSPAKRAGNGGDGAVSDITGMDVHYAGGGGGGGSANAWDLYDYGFGGLGGGGDGGKGTAGAKGTDGLGGGGGGGGWTGSNQIGGAGGSGVLIIRHPMSAPDLLEVSSTIAGILSEPTPDYGFQTGLAAGQTVAASCGTTPWTDGTNTYSCSGWKLYDNDGNVVSNGTETSFAYVHPDPADYRRLEWQWIADSVGGTITAGAGGTVSPSGTAIYPADEPLTVTATPAEGWVFVRWTGTLPAGIDATSASVTFTPAAPFDMVAVFSGIIHVATDGDNENPGTEAEPFLTISNAIAKADVAIAGGAPSMVIRVAAGAYDELGLVVTNPIAIVGSGSATNPDDCTILQPAKLIGNNTRAIHLNHPDAVLENFKVKAATRYGNNNNGVNVYLTDGTVRGCWIAGNGENRDNLFMTGGLVEDTRISDGSRVNWENPGDGVNVWATGGHLRRCVVTGGAGGVSAGLSGATVMENSLVTKASLYRTSAGQTANAWAVTLSGTAKLVNCTVAGNTCFTAANSSVTRTPAGGAVKVNAATAQVVNCALYGNNCEKSAMEWGNANAASFLNCAVGETAAAGLTNETANGNIVIDDYDFEALAMELYGPTHSSRLIDAGADLSAIGEFSATDLAGNARRSPAAAPVDIGCYELDQNSLSCGFNAFPSSAICGVDATFAAAATGGNGSYLYKWDFGDGTAAQTTADATASHAYAAAGFYTATVAVSDDGGETWSAPTALPLKLVVAPSDIYVDAANASPVFPYDTPAKAATTLRDAFNCLTNEVPATLGMTAVDGVTIHVAPATYPESGFIIASAVRVVGGGSATNAENCVLVQPAKLAGNSTRTFYLNHAGAILENVKVRVGARNYNDNGVNVYLVDGTVRGCWIAGNGEAGDNLNMLGGLVEDTKISDGNRVNYGNPGDGVNVYATGGRLRRCLVTGGMGGNSIRLNGATVMENSLITKTTNYRNSMTEARPDYYTAWAVKLFGTAKLVNCTIAGNTCFYGANETAARTPAGGAVWLGSATAQVVNCAICGNDCDKSAMEWGNANAACFLGCAVPETGAAGLTNETANGNIVIDEYDFEGFMAGLYQPVHGSRLIDAGANLSAIGEFSATDLDGNARRSPASAPVDIGCYELGQDSLSCGFTVSAATALCGTGVTFTPAVYGAGSAEITCRWDFDDGGSPVTAALEPRTYAFATAKEHVVTLSVSTDGGSTWAASYTAPVPVLTAPADIWVDETNASGAVHPYATEATAATNLFDALGMLTNAASAGSTALDGVTIHVKPGTYPGIGYPTLGSAVTIVGVGSRDAVIFDAEQKGRPFYLRHVSATLSGVTVRNGMSKSNAPYGGNVSMDNGVVTNCVVKDGRTSGNDYSNGLNIRMAGGLVIDSVVSGGAYTGAWHPSTGLNISMLAGRVSRCVISGARGCSTGNGSDAVNMQGGVIENCLLTDNKTTGGAININQNGATARAVNCTVVTNSSSGSLVYSHGIFCNNTSARVVNCVLFENGGTAATEWGNKNPACFYNCAFSEAAAFTGANSTVKDLTDAAFRKYANGDYRPKSGGALVDAGTSWEDYLSFGAMSAADLLGNARVLHKLLDIGCYENQTSAATQVILR